MLLNNIVIVVDYGLCVYVFFCVAIVLFSMFFTVIGELNIIILYYIII